MSLFKRLSKNRGAQHQKGRVLEETYVPVRLRPHGENLNTVITGDFEAMDENYLESIREKASVEVGSMIEYSDEFTTADICDGKIDGLMNKHICRHQEDNVMKELQADHISQSMEARKEELERKIPVLGKRIEARAAEIDSLKDLHTVHEVRLLGRCFSTGLLATLVCGIVDALLNFSFLQDILVENAILLGVCVMGLSVLSDGTMYVLGNMISNWSEKDMPLQVKKCISFALAGLFICSVIGSVGIRLGSMEQIFGSVAVKDSAGQSIFTLAQWTIAALTALLTPCTGVISFACSVDRSRSGVVRRRNLEQEQATDEETFNELSAEYLKLCMSKSPAYYCSLRNAAAMNRLEALRTELKLDARTALALHQADCTYTQAMGNSMNEMMADKTLAYPFSQGISDAEKEAFGEDNSLSFPDQLRADDETNEPDHNVIDMKGVI